jgi:peptide chain release factor 2
MRRSFFDLAGRQVEQQKLQSGSLQPDFWNDRAHAQEVMRRIAAHQDIIERFERLERDIADAGEIASLFEDDKSASTELDESIARVEKELRSLEELGMFDSPEDARSAILSIHPGAGGTESCDWAEMLYRMHTRYIEGQGLKCRVLDYQAGDLVGLKDVTIEITGTNAYGLLKSEAGVHRLVRTSPFDANQRRHTSFAAVSVLPEVDDIEVEINAGDLRIDTFRAGGHGGQNVNKISSAVRITHVPTRIVVVCQNERSQLQNKQNAFKVLRARLHDHHKQAQDKKRHKIEQAKTDIAWGHQIRSYVFFPYQMVKDHRTGIETHNVEAVMNGEIEQFVHAYLKQTSASDTPPGNAGR